MSLDWARRKAGVPEPRPPLRESAARAVPPGLDGAGAFAKSEIELSIGQRFDRIVRDFPENAAVREPNRVTTYAELDAGARAVGRALTGLGNRSGPIALLLDAGAPLFAAMLGALKAGRFYVPLDTRLAPARLEAIWKSLDAAALIADAASLERARRLASDGAPVWQVEELVGAETGGFDPVSVSAGDLAYVLFTSGSTGTPKGVMQSHRNVLHAAWKVAAALSLCPEDRLTLLSPPSYGASVSDIFGALLTGASVCPHPLTGDGLRRLPDFLEREAITVYHSVPSVFRTFWSTLDGRADLSRIRVVRLGGEPVLASDFHLYTNRFSRGCRFHVGLGATEMNMIRHWEAGPDTRWPSGVPLGYPVDGTDVVLLDEHGRENPEEGEIGVIARTLALGYWRDPAGTAAAFREVPGRPGARLFRTGDLGKMLPDGFLLYSGRKDARLKIRGYRVETAEVEAALLDVPGVREAAVDGRDGPDGARLVAWLARRGEDPPQIADLRRALAGRLSDHMIPSGFVFLDALPRTATGKVDRGALPDPERTRPAVSTAFVEPRGEAESLAASAFARALELDQVGAADDFFELGGDSLSAVELLTVLSDALGAELSVADLIEAPTPAGLANRARRRGVAEPAGLVRLGEETGSPVFVVPGGGGDGEDLFTARRLARLTGGGFSYYGFRCGPAPHPPVEQLAARCVADLQSLSPHGPYRLIGDCVGGILAFAIARRLTASGERVALLALVDTPFPKTPRRLRAWLLARVPWLEHSSERLRYFRKRLQHHAGVLRSLPGGRLAYARRIAGIGARGLVEPYAERRREARDRRASYVATLLAWRPEPFEGTVHRVESEEAQRRRFGDAWSRVAHPGEVVRVPADHKSLILEHGASVAGALARWLAAAG